MTEGGDMKSSTCSFLSTTGILLKKTSNTKSPFMITIFFFLKVCDAVADQNPKEEGLISAQRPDSASHRLPLHLNKFKAGFQGEAAYF